MRDLLVLLFLVAICSVPAFAQGTPDAKDVSIINLPTVQVKSRVTVEQAIRERRSVRAYSETQLSLQEVSQLLWAAQGITEPTRGLRSAPSAMGTYPLDLYLVAGDVRGLPSGVYKYIPKGHQLELVATGDKRNDLGKQPQMTKAPADLVYAADKARLQKLGDKGMLFAAMEAGHSAQNVLLEEVALGLVGVGMAGFDENDVRSALKLSPEQTPMYVVSAGRKR